MYFKHIKINQLTNLEVNCYLGVKVRACAQRVKIGKDKVYRYYNLFDQGFTVQEIYNQYLINKYRCGRKPTDLSVYSQEELNRIAYKWNSIPRKSLDYKTPNEVIKEATGFERLLPVA